jgi:hypothetical protein
MSKYPIWNNVTACIYKSSKSFGVKDTGEVEVLIGSSVKNSHPFLTTLITQKNKETKFGYCKVFTYSIDDVIIKKAYFNLDAKGNANELLKIETKLNKIKGLK